MTTAGTVRGGVGRRRRALRSLGMVAACAVPLTMLASCVTKDQAPAQPTILRVLMTDDWVTAPFLATVRDFERTHPDVRIDVAKAPISHMIDTVTAAMKNGVSPDVVQAHAFSAAAQGLAQRVDDLWARNSPLKASDFLPGAVDDVTWAGHLYGVPLDTNALFLLYNADQFSTAKVAEPTRPYTFASFEQAARSLSSPDGQRRALAIPTSTWWTYGWIKANGGELLHVAPDGKVQLTLDDPGTVGALDYLARLVREGLAFPPNAADSHSGDALGLFRGGAASTLASGSWDLATVQKDADGAKYRSTPMPSGVAGASGSVMGGSSMWVPTGSHQRTLAFEFMALLISDKYALRLAKEQGRLPVRTRLYNDPFFKTPALKAVIDQLPTASPFKLSAFPEAHDVFADAIDQVLRGGKPASTVMADAQKRAQALLPPSP